MIRLRSDCLVFRTASGEGIPCAVDQVVVELIGGQAARLEPEVLQDAAAGVLHYFRDELGRDTVSVGEFAQALAQVLRRLGLNVVTDDEPPARGQETDLRRLACESGKGFELVFFARLRAELRRRLLEGPHTVRFVGLRGCVKQLIGARRWCPRCQRLSDQIVEYLRACLPVAAAARDCALVVE